MDRSDVSLRITHHLNKAAHRFEAEPMNSPCCRLVVDKVIKKTKSAP
tara:strand:- start:277 stop:417 length:141 start_codon:yes stop_codon:yes gene_type:complete